MVSVALTDNDSSGTDLTTYSYTCTIGAGDGSRTLIFPQMARAAANGRTLLSVTVDGVAATLFGTQKSQDDGANSTVAAAAWIAASALGDPTATSVTVAATYSGGMIRAACEAYVSTDALDLAGAVISTDGNTHGGGTVAASLNLNVAADAALIAFCACASVVGAGAAAWTGATEDIAETAVENMVYTSAHSNDVPAAAPRTVGVSLTSISGTGGFAAMAIAIPPAAGDVTAPVLSNPAGTATGETTASLGVDTDEGNGTLFWVVTQSATPPSGAQVAAGQDHSSAPAVASNNQPVSGTGTQNANATGLTAATTYWAHFVQDDTAANRSNVATSASFVTDSAVVPVTPIAADEGTGGGGRRRRGRRYPYPNVIDDGWDWEGPDARAEPQKPQERPPESVQPVPAPEPRPAPKRPAGLAEAVSEASRPAAPVAEPEEPKAAPEGDRVAALEAEVESLREKVARLEAARRDDEEEQRLLMMLLEDTED